MATMAVSSAVSTQYANVSGNHSHGHCTTAKAPLVYSNAQQPVAATS